MRNITRRAIQLIVGSSVSAIFIVLTLRHIGQRDLVAALSEIRFSTVFSCIGILAVEYWFRTVRWWLMLREHDQSIRLRQCAWPLLLSVAVNNVAPLRAGDALRVAAFRKQLGAPGGYVLGTVITERVLDVTTLLLFLLLGIASLTPLRIAPAYSNLAAIMLFAIVAVWAIALLGGQRLQRLLLLACGCQALQRRNWSHQAEYQVKQLILGLTLVRSPIRVLQLLALSGVVWILDGIIFMAIANSLGYQGKLFGPWFALAASTLSTVVPSAPGYLGTFDFFAMSGLMTYGASHSMAAPFAVAVHALLWFPLTLAGVVYSLIPRRAPDSGKLRWCHKERTG